MFSEKTYINRRNELRRLMLEKGAKGYIVLFGNNDVPYNYKANTYDYFRQDSTFRYFFGLNEPGLVGVLELQEGNDFLVGKEQTDEDIIWSGQKISLKELAFNVGITSIVNRIPDYPEVHYIPAYRHDIQKVIGKPSKILIESIVTMRSVKDLEEIKHLTDIQHVAYRMHTKAMLMAVSGTKEQSIVAELFKITREYGGNVSFPIICSRDGQILHNLSYKNILKNGDLLLVDAGFESSLGYCTDHTRVWLVGDKLSAKQSGIYNTVLRAKSAVAKNAAPGIFYKDMHLLAAKKITEGLKNLGLMKGDIDEAVAIGAHALFFPHGLGHMMGLDVHDMENLGEDFVGYDSTIKRSEQFGLAYLRMARKLQEGFVVTNEPGIYFIPQLIDKWQAEKKFVDFINYEEVQKYKDFGGIRLEDDLLITSEGCRSLGIKSIP